MFFNESVAFYFVCRETQGQTRKKCPTCRKPTDERVSHVAELTKNPGSARSESFSFKLSSRPQHHFCHARTCKDLKCIEHRLSAGIPSALVLEARGLLKEIIQGHGKKWELFPFELEEAKRLLREYPEPVPPKNLAA